MKLLFDLSMTQPLYNAEYHGGGKYGLSVFKKLAEIAPQKIAVYYDDKLKIDKEACNIIMNNGIPCFKKSQMGIYEATAQVGNVVYKPMLLREKLPPKEITLITTIHDLRGLTLPNDRYAKALITKRFASFIYYKKTIIREIRAKRELEEYLEECLSKENVKIVTVSNHSKGDFLNYFPFLEVEKIKVFYSPSTLDKSVITQNTEEYGKYWLMVSANRSEKNAPRTIKAFDDLFSRHPHLQGRVLMTGLENRNQLNMKIRNEGRFVFLGYVNEVTLKSLYHGAYLFVYPTLNEGFGYPPIEAMSVNCPVIASAVSSVTEVCGDSVMYFNPFDIKEIQNRILQMEDANIRNAYITKGLRKCEEIEKRQELDLHNLCNYLLSFV